MTARAQSYAAVLGAGLVLAGCSFASDVLWPTLTGEEPSGQTTAPASQTSQSRPIAPSAGERSNQPTISTTAPAPAAPPTLGTSSFSPPSVTPGAPTGSFVGEKVVQFRNELRRLQNEIREENGKLQNIRRETSEHSQRYHATVATIQARLQVGTTPGNPILVNQWNAAQALVDQVGNDVAKMNSLATEVSNSSTLSAYLLESTRAAYGLSGAVDEDHRQLAILEDEVNRTVVLIDRLLNELSEDINRQSAYLSAERRNLTALSLSIKNGELYGTSLANRAFSSVGPVASAGVASAPIASAAPGTARRRPLVVIRFDRRNVQYEQPLYTAVSRALERRPDAAFDLVAVAPLRGTPADVTLATNTSKRNAETVLRSLANMGLPLDRVRLSAVTSSTAQSNEVHIYVR